MSMFIAAKSLKPNDVISLDNIGEVTVSKVEKYRRFGRKWVDIDFYVNSNQSARRDGEIAVPADTMLPWRGTGLDL